MKTIVFDIGNVLVAWDPLPAFLPELGTREAAAAFLERVGFNAWNLENDRGRSMAEAVAAVESPDDASILARYAERFHLTIPEPIHGTWAILDRLKERGHPLHAITNWGAETWPVGLAAYPRLGEVFGVTVVSGHEGMIKPDAEIFALFCDRAGVAPGDCLFIDDSPANVTGARAFGMDAVRFTSPEELAAELSARGV